MAAGQQPGVRGSAGAEVPAVRGTEGSFRHHFVGLDGLDFSLFFSFFGPGMCTPVCVHTHSQGSVVCLGLSSAT